MCKICGVEKPLSEFTINKTSKKTGKKSFKSFCKKCVGIYSEISKGRPNTGRFKKGNIPWTQKIKDGRFSLRAKRWVNDILEKDGYKCQACNSTKRLVAHHIKSWKDYPELRFELGNGQTLCNPCHSELHGREICNLLKNGISWNKGKKMSKEHCRNLSEAHKGFKPSEETLKKLRGRIPWNKGKKLKELEIE